MVTSERDVIIKARDEARVSLYGGSSENLIELRYRKYMKKVAPPKQAVQPYSFPATRSASKFCYLRIYRKSQLRKICQTQLMRTQADFLHPTYTDIPHAPGELLKFNVSKCKSDCSTLRCVCRKHGLNCSPACIDWLEGNCTNISRIFTMPLHESESDEEIMNQSKWPHGLLCMKH